MKFTRLWIIAFALVVLALVFLLPTWSADKAAKPAAPGAATNDKVIGIVNGQQITEADVRALAQGELAQLARECEARQHKIIESQLDRAIQERLLDAEAAARGITREQLLAEIKPLDVTDADVDKFYEDNKDKIGRPREQIAVQLRQYLKQRGQLEARQKYFEGLEAKYKVEKKLDPLRTEVAATGPAKGPETAPVTIVEFSDFQCPFCGRLIPTLEQVEAKYGDKVRIVFRQFPLPIHPNAQKAAEASLCANEQGKFWEMHDAMFKNQQELAVDNLKSKAAALGLKLEQFISCLDSDKYAAQVQTDQKDGASAGVRGTPALFINGRFVNGLVPIEQISTVIDDELKRKGGA